MAINANYMARETAANLTRNITLTLASILTVFVSLAIVGTVVLIRQGAQNMTDEFEGGIEFIVYVQADINDADLALAREDLDANPGIQRWEYVDDEATMEAARRLFADQPTMLENIRSGDLPTSFKVEPVDKRVETIQELVNYYRNRPYVVDVRAATEALREVKGITTFVNNGLTVFAVALLVSSALLILNSIRTAMFARRREIEVMKLVGATNWFIRIPFMLEGLIQGLIGGTAAIGLVLVIRGWIDSEINHEGGLMLLQLFAIYPADVRLACFVVAAIALVLSVGSSLVATRRYLDV